MIDIIDEVTYVLPESNYIKTECVKNKIILCHSGSSDMKHFLKWTTRLNGKYQKTAAYSIDVSGKIYQHFEPENASMLMGDPEIDKSSIIIVLDNEGWLSREIENPGFSNWIGYIYDQTDKIVERKWREQTYWAPYTQEQFDSAADLVNMLCFEFSIPNVVVPHNTKLDDLDFDGVLYRSNFEKHYTDLSPAWLFKEFKDRVEKI